ncbi:hypothetical protein F383_36022 [Gossypium arboreum]|uniref:Uncharacterized protein n=1 Tax=Gossypium arboreum TaxID=29729 RepID=A0A0B0N3B7_GOSAR|nr:hypothetical protein F383_36022 [Gossypium arboreum]
MRHKVSILLQILFDEAVGAELVCWLDPCIHPSPSHFNRGN